MTRNKTITIRVTQEQYDFLSSLDIPISEYANNRIFDTNQTYVDEKYKDKYIKPIDENNKTINSVRNDLKIMSESINGHGRNINQIAKILNSGDSVVGVEEHLSRNAKALEGNYRNLDILRQRLDKLTIERAY